MIKTFFISIFVLLVAQSEAQLNRSSLLGRYVAEAPAAPKDTSYWFFSATSKSCSPATNVFGNSGTGGAVRTGTSNGHLLTTVSTSNHVNISGANTNDVAGTMTSTVVSDCYNTENHPMRGYMFNNAAYDHSKVQFSVNGYDPAKTYKILISGSTSVASRNLAVRVEGASLSSEQTVTVTNNTANAITFTGQYPSASGIFDFFTYRTTASGGMVGFIKIIEE